VDSNSETQLVEAAQNGCLASFGVLYERFYGTVVALAYSMLADRDTAEDAAQEVFAVACCRIGTLKDKGKFGPWLAGICRNTSRQMLKVGKGPRRVALPNEAPAPTSDTSSERREAIHRAVKNLRRSERELIVLRYFDGFSQAQISGILDLSPQAVNGRLVRAKRKIAAYLKRDGFKGVNNESVG
jgi:RNA polymerase sigma-70 factor (ECF subfamily)